MLSDGSVDESLDSALSALEAALPKGWWIDGLYQRRLPEGDTWEALAGEEHWQGGEDYHIGTGPTPAAALRALIAALDKAVAK